MRAVEVFAQSDLDPAVSQALDGHLLAAAAGHPSSARLRVYRLAGDVLSLGRYHLAPAAGEGGVRLHRRLGGGRVLPLGAGFATVSLILPHRSALVGDDPLALRPEQALNRCVRALLGGLRELGVEAFYPGRDRIAVGGRMLGVVSLECARSGATAFEAMIAVDDDWPSLPALVAAVDCEQVLAVEIPTAEQVTSLAAHGVSPTAAALAECMAGSLARQFGLAPTPVAAPTLPADAAAHGAAWVAARRRSPALGRHAVAWGQLGIFEVYLATRDGAIDELLLTGDFIADSPSIARLEGRLRGCAAGARRDRQVVDDVYADPRSFLLGVGSLGAVADTIARADRTATCRIRSSMARRPRARRRWRRWRARPAAPDAAELTALCECLDDPHKLVQRRAAEAFAALARRGVPVEPHLRVALAARRSCAVRWGAVYALSLIGPLPRAALPTLLEVIGLDDGDLRWAAADLLEQLAARERPAVVAGLLGRGGRPGPQRKMALYCLRDLGVAEAFDAALAALADAHVETRLAALAVVAAVHPDPIVAAERIAALIDDGDPRLQRAAAGDARRARRPHRRGAGGAAPGGIERRSVVAARGSAVAAAVGVAFLECGGLPPLWGGGAKG